jgi:Spy/CpxP family protein refolding chaperone
MTKTKIALYVALIFLAGGVTGAGVRSMWKQPRHPSPPVRNGEDFANHIFNRMKERLQLTPEQIARIEPVFRKGIEDVRAIQDRSVKEVEAAVKRNHKELSNLLTPEQRQKLEEWDREREKFRKGRRRGGTANSLTNAANAASSPEKSLNSSATNK